MASMQLTSPAYANGGRYLETGTIVTIGDGKHEITEERATDIIAGERAIEVEDEAEPESDDAPAPATRKRANAAG